MSASSADAPDSDARSATLLAIRNGLTLGAGLLLTWSIALGIRVILPRHLGPTLFGTLNFADGFTATCFVVLSLGVDQYIHKEVAVRPSHASDFYGGATILRLALTTVIFGFMAGLLLWTNRPAEVRNVVYLYGATQFMVTANATLSAMLHAKGRVSGMSALSVFTKVVWAVGVVISIATGAGLWAYAVSYLASETIDTVVLTWLAKKHLRLHFLVDWPATTKMLKSSLPYTVAGIATAAYVRLDVTLLEFTEGSKEVGLYGAASAVAGLTLLLSPVIGWVVQPMMSRASARSHDELFGHMARAMELILSIGIPAGLMINLGANFLVRVLFGAQFASAEMALHVMATRLVLTYVAMLYAMLLVMLNRPWAMAVISVAGLVVNAGLNVLFLHFAVGWLGEGGGGTGCAAAMFGTEVFVTACMAIAVGRSAIDGRGALALGKALGVTAMVVGLHRLCSPLGDWRLILDAVVYFVVAVAVGALRPRDMINTVKDAVRRRGA